MIHKVACAKVLSELQIASGVWQRLGQGTALGDSRWYKDRTRETVETDSLDIRCVETRSSQASWLSRKRAGQMY